MWLKLKISIGYGILMLLLVFTVHFFRREQTLRDTLRKGEETQSRIRNLTERTYAGLLDLASQAELVAVWEEEELDEYRRKRQAVCDTLQTLRYHIRTFEQQARIDSLCLLLQEKEELLSVTMTTFRQLEEVNHIVRERIPSIVSSVQSKPSPDNKDTGPLQEKKRSFWNLFRKRTAKSAYLQEKEKQEQRDSAAGNPVRNTAVLLYSLDREVNKRQKEQQDRLLSQMDSLYAGSMRLNRKMTGLTADFEREASIRLSRRYNAFIAQREGTYRMATVLGLLVFLTAIVLYVIVHRDLNKLHRYEKKLEASDRKNRELLASKKKMMMGIAHDLRAPLAVIKGSADLLPEEGDKARQEEYVENIRHSSDYMLRLVNTLIEFYLLDTDRFAPDKSVFRLEDLFKEMAMNFAGEAQKKHIRFITEFCGLEAIVDGDRMHIQQIAGNLLSNAVKFTMEGEIRFHAEYMKGELHFSVQDTGLGMDKEEKSRIFNAFERLDNARNISGFGLGLAISSMLVSQMGGSITVESSPGQGSTFMVFLPLPEASGSSQIEETSVPDDRLNRISVLVIDDDRIQLNIIREMLKRCGVRCDCCETSRELFDRLREQDYDLILTDIQMSGTDGYGILELLRSSNMETARKIPVVAMTARANDESEYLSCGFADCIHKPFTPEDLSHTILRTTGRKAGETWKPDLSLILSGEENRQEMLELLVSEMQKDLAGLEHALERHDRITAVSILHKDLPLWTSVRLGYPLSRLKELAASEVENNEDELYEEIPKITAAVKKLITYCEQIKETNE